MYATLFPLQGFVFVDLYFLYLISDAANNAVVEKKSYILSCLCTYSLSTRMNFIIDQQILQTVVKMFNYLYAGLCVVVFCELYARIVPCVCFHVLPLWLDKCSTL